MSDFKIENGTLKKYTGKGGVVVIPDSVTSIGEDAFRGCTGLTGITIPDSVTSIGWGAFKGCTGLTGITIPDSVTSIEGAWCGGTFSGCTGLTAITIPDSVKSIGDCAFSGCTGLTSITIPDSVTSIGWRAFEGCTGLTGITIPDSVTSIGGSAFKGCTGLTGITIPDSVTSIGDRAFYGCTGLTGITIPDSVTSIGWRAFYGCTGLTGITIPDSVTSIGDYAFRGCTGLTGITIPDSVTSIGSAAFYGCTGLTGITIPDSVTSIGSAAFYGCTGLTGITIPDSVTSIGDYAFRGCTGLTGITIPDSVMSIGWCAFSGCTGLTGIQVDPGNKKYQSVNNCLLEGNTLVMGCKESVIPASVTSIGNCAFSGCTGLTGITIPDGVTSIGGCAFSGCTGLTGITIPNSVTSIGDDAFSGCTGLTGITIPDSVTSIGDWAFYGCTGLTGITIPDSVTSIGDWAFSGCTGLTGITIPDSVTSIDRHAFDDCSSLTVIVLKGKLTSALRNGFKPCKKIKAVVPYSPDESLKNKDEAWLDAKFREIKEAEKDKKNMFFEAAQARGEVLCCSLPAAMRYAEKLGLLDFYAELHGTTADALREENMSSFGLDENGECRWSLAGRNILAKLDTDLVLTLTDEKNGKAIKSIPKKDADPEAYEAANAAFKEMKKSLSEMTKIWGNKLFAEFLSGESRGSERWQKLFLGNPMMRGLGRLIVWNQDGNTFTLHEDGKPYDVNGDAVTLKDAPISVAHPMEMNPEEVAAWQNYFLSNHLKQPFEQVWEPVVDASFVKPGRYDDCTIELYRLMNKEKHGIIMKGQSEIELKGCSADLKFIEGHSEWVHNLFEIQNFKFTEYTRQVNHIVVLLDRGTVEGRIAKDDVTVAQWLDHFTAAQIAGFIKLANENNANGVKAILLDYQNKHFETVDPLAEFTLGW